MQRIKERYWTKKHHLSLKFSTKKPSTVKLTSIKQLKCAFNKLLAVKGYDVELEWQVNRNKDPFEAAVGSIQEYVVYYSEFDDGDDESVKGAVISALKKALELLQENITEESVYFLLEWDVVYSTLTVVVTDKSKENDSSNVVKCYMKGVDERFGENGLPDDLWEKEVKNYSSSVREWVRDYLSSCSSFFESPLIAVYHDESRDSASPL